MLVYCKQNGEPIESPQSTDLKIIEMYINRNHLDWVKIATGRLFEAYEDFKETENYEVAIFEGMGF
ncbi:unnamed protein product [Meloidogyne enterolobii]|uniref:Uncharacterized protein n=1 Tax=Meloidogyne enterolobii TaxID=390850 RepID=A0ACB1A5E5_MELEN